jgi:hypothetical protein
MTVVSQKIQSLIGGVSQQPDSLKLPNQLRVCTDFYPDPTFGLAKRPGFKAISALSGAAAEGTWFQVIRDDEERYVVQVARNGVVKVWNADSGQAQVVNAIAGPAQTYATHTNDDELEIFQINDYVLLLNRTKIVTQSTALTGSRIPYGYVSINSVGYNTEYKITLNATTYTYQTTNTTTVRLSVEDVVTGIVATINAGGVWTATGVGSYIYIAKNDNAEFSLKARGGTSGNALDGFYGVVSSPAELPRQFIQNATIRVLAPEGGDDYWVIFQVEDGSSSGAGVWEETVAPAIRYTYNINTLPHALIREANGSFTYRQLDETSALAQVESATVNGIVDAATVTSGTNGIYSAGVSFWVSGGTGTNLRLRVTSTDVNGHVTGVEVSRGGSGYTVNDVVTNEYGDTFTVTSITSDTVYADSLGSQYYKPRIVGDLTSNQYPSFVDNTISGISFYKNRLVFLSGENVICSQVGDYFNFFLSTVTTIVDSDAIDLSCGSLKPIDLRYALNTTRGLALFADNAQYILETRTDAFSAASAEINQIGSYDMSTKIAPQDMGPTIAFIDQGDRSCTVFEVLIGSDSNSRPQTAELTRTIPSYLPSYVSSMRSSTAASTLGIHSRRDPRSLYLFRFYNVGNERQQASWFKWTLPGELKSFYFENDDLRVVLIPDGQTEPALVRMSLITETSAAPLSFEGFPIDVRLDCYSYRPTLVYDGVEDKTRVCFPAGFGNTTTLAAVVQTNGINAGGVTQGYLTYDAGEPADQQYYLELDGDLTSDTFAIGYVYNAMAVLPAFYVISDERKDTYNLPTVQRLYIDSSNSGPYQVTVSALGRNPYTVRLPQVTSNQSEFNALPIIRNAQNIVPVMARGDQVDVTLECPDPFPTSITSYTWVGQYNNRGIRPI